MNRSEALQLLIADVARAPLHLAGNVEIGLRIRDALNDPDCRIDTAAKLIQAEPALSAQVVAIANSVAYNPSGRAITDVKNAVSRIGFATLRSLATAHVVKHMAGAPSDPSVRELTDHLWRHTTHVAALCRTIARRVTRQDPETALFIGLVHEVGSFYILSRASDYPVLLAREAAPDAAAPSLEEQTEAARQRIDTEEEDNELDLEGELTLAVLRQLNMPESIVATVQEYCAGYMALPPASMADTLLLAESLAPVGSPISSIVETDESQHPSIDAVIGETSLQEILREAAEEVESLARALGN